MPAFLPLGHVLFQNVHLHGAHWEVATGNGLKPMFQIDTLLLNIFTTAASIYIVLNDITVLNTYNFPIPGSAWSYLPDLKAPFLGGQTEAGSGRSLPKTRSWVWLRRTPLPSTTTLFDQIPT